MFQFGRFCLVGLANTALGLSVIFALMYLADVPPVPANVLGYAAGLCLSFFANGKWTFRRAPSGRIAFRFFLAFGLSYGVNLVVLLGLLTWTDVAPWAAQTLALATYTLTFFFLSKFFVYTDDTSVTREAAK